MSRVWFAGDLETAATYWRVARRDGITLGFTTHDRDLWFDGVLHRAAPGMLPSAIRQSADLEPDSAEVEGALSHDAISAADLSLGRFDRARVTIGLVDWTTLETQSIYSGVIGAVSEEDGSFTAAIDSRKLELQRDPVPRTSPSCRAQFCGPGCSLSSARFTREIRIEGADSAANTVTCQDPSIGQQFALGTLRWLDGPYAGITIGIAAASSGILALDAPLDQSIPAGTAAMAREGCDHTLATCAARFGNAINFQGEPHLPGNDFITRYPAPAS